MLRQRLRQFAAAGQAPGAKEEALARKYLAPPFLALFLAQHPRDVFHAAATARWLLGRGHDDPLLIQAALLHDIGKGDQRRLDRVAHVAVTTLGVGQLAAHGGSRLRVRRALARSASHAETGAAMLLSAGADARVVELTRLHHDAAPAHDPVLALLKVADAES